MSESIKIDDKRMINAKADIGVLFPIKYKFAWDSYCRGTKNRWSPQEISMTRDIEDWKSNTKLTKQEREMLIWNFSFFATAESLTANNILLGLYRHLTAPECRQYLLLQGAEESVHIETYAFLIDSLGMDIEKIYNAYTNVPEIEAKDKLCMSYIDPLMDPHFKTGTFENDLKLLKAMVVFAGILEGSFFYSGFAQVLSLGRRNKMPGTCEMLQYIARDECTHIQFGLDACRAIILENPHLWTKEVQQELRDLFHQAILLEDAYTDASSQRILGFSVDDYKKYVRYNADKRLEYLGLDVLYNQVVNTLPWIDEQSGGIRKEQNFFEKKVTEYTVGGSLQWEDE